MKFLGKTKVFTTIFYILAVLFCLYTIFQTVTTISYLSSVASSGMYVDVGFSDMLSAFVSAVGPNVFYTVILFFCGYAIQLIAGDIIPEDQEFEEKISSTSPEAVSTEATPALTQEPQGEETLVINDDYQPADLTAESDEPSVEDYVATIADVEGEVQEPVETETLDDVETVDVVITPPPEEETADENTDEVEQVKKLEEDLAEAIDESEAQNEVEELEITNEEDE